MKKLLLIFAVMFVGCKTRNFTTSQDFYKNKPISAQYPAPDTIVTIYHYKWHREHGKQQIYERQDMQRDSTGKLFIIKDWYAYDDNKIIHGFVKKW